jgi:hypothetical protein
MTVADIKEVLEVALQLPIAAQFFAVILGIPALVIGFLCSCHYFCVLWHGWPPPKQYCCCDYDDDDDGDDIFPPPIDPDPFHDEDLHDSKRVSQL